MDNRQHAKPVGTRMADFIKERWAELLNPKRAWQDAIGQALASNYYQGTVPDAVVARRRAKNKVARASRRKNRVR